MFKWLIVGVVLLVVLRGIYMGQRKLSFAKYRRASKTRYNIGNHSQASKLHKIIGDISSQIWWIRANTIFQKSFQKTDKNRKNGKKHLVYVMIPGNPGISSVYVHWMQTLVSMFNHYKTHFDYSRKLKRTESMSMIDHMPSNIGKLLLKYESITAFSISHANHACDMKNANNNKLYDLNEQIQHKIEFIQYLRNKNIKETIMINDNGNDDSKNEKRRIIENDCRELRSLYENDANGENIEFILAGHSVGAYICLNILKHYEKVEPSFAQNGIKQVHLWCPTITNIGMSPNGLKFTKIFKYGRPFLPLLSKVLGILNYQSFVHFLLIPAELVMPDSVAFDLACQNAKALENIVYMASDEFKSIVGLTETGMDDILLKFGKNKLAFYWAKTDLWAPSSNWDEIIQLFKVNNKNDKQFDIEKYLLHWEIVDDLKHALIIDDASKFLEEKLTEKVFQFIAKSMENVTAL